ncbi:hypothetical protein TNCV_1864941 [Trichonephila clavipes]|nr:hypothetical protein TNCV_1864941 [Trichonephila clavipes]
MSSGSVLEGRPRITTLTGRSCLSMKLLNSTPDCSSQRLEVPVFNFVAHSNLQKTARHLGLKKEGAINLARTTNCLQSPLGETKNGGMRGFLITSGTTT